MKRMMTKSLLFMVAITILSSSMLFAEEKAEWDVFSKNLVAALKTPNTGLRVSAMQQIIKYADKVNVDGAAFDLIKLYRNHRNEDVRRMALVTINSINNDWAQEIVKRDFAFEKSESIKKMMAAIIKQGRNQTSG